MVSRKDFFHRISTTNRLLTKLNAMNNEVCSFSQNESEILPHLFWECMYVQRFWFDFSPFLDSKINDFHMRGRKLDFIWGIEIWYVYKLANT